MATFNGMEIFCALTSILFFMLLNWMANTHLSSSGLMGLVFGVGLVALGENRDATSWPRRDFRFIAISTTPLFQADVLPASIQGGDSRLLQGFDRVAPMRECRYALLTGLVALLPASPWDSPPRKSAASVLNASTAERSQRPPSGQYQEPQFVWQHEAKRKSAFTGWFAIDRRQE